MTFLSLLLYVNHPTTSLKPWDSSITPGFTKSPSESGGDYATRLYRGRLVVTAEVLPRTVCATEIERVTEGQKYVIRLCRYRLPGNQTRVLWMAVPQGKPRTDAVLKDFICPANETAMVWDLRGAVAGGYPIVYPLRSR